MVRRPPRSTRTYTLFSLHDALPIFALPSMSDRLIMLIWPGWPGSSKLMLGASATSISTSLSSRRSEEHTSELQSLMRISYAVFCLKKKINNHYKEQKYSKQ